MRSDCRVRSAITLMPTKSATAQRSAIAASARREARNRDIVSIRLLEVDEDDVGEQEDPDHRGEEDGIAQIDDAAGDGAEMREEAERRDRRDDPVGRPGLEEAEDDARAAHREEEAHGGGDD